MERLVAKGSMIQRLMGPASTFKHVGRGPILITNVIYLAPSQFAVTHRRGPGDGQVAKPCHPLHLQLEVTGPVVTGLYRDIVNELFLMQYIWILT